MTETMRTAICSEPNQIGIQEFPVPSLEKDRILVKVSLCGVCGSDLAVWNGSGHKKFPYSPGHEFCGTVEKMDDNVQGLEIGQRVVIDPNLGCGECEYCQRGKPNLCDFLKTRNIKSNGGFSEYVSLDYRMAHVLPDSFPDELAPFIEPLSCGIHTARCAKVEAGNKVVVFGAGTMGLLTGLALVTMDCEVIFVEPAEVRRTQIDSLFSASVMTPQELAEANLTDKVDVVIDCSGRVEAVCQGIKLLRKGGRVVLAGLIMNAGKEPLPLIEVTNRELEIVGTWLNPMTFRDSIEIAAENENILKQLKTLIFRLDEIDAAFKQALNQDINKILVKP